MPKAQDEPRAGIARRDGKPVLDFLILVYRSGTRWTARAIMVGGVSEGESEEAAVANLLTAIDFSIAVCEDKGLSAEDWYSMRRQRMAEKTYIRSFLEVIAKHDPERLDVEAPSGHYIRNLAVAKQDAA